MDPLGIRPRFSEMLFVLRLSGDLDIDTQSRFESTVCGLLERGSVVVDLSRLEFMAISSLRSLVICHRLAASRGHALLFAAPSRQARRLLSVSRLDGFLNVRSSVGAACADLPLRQDALRATYWLGAGALTSPEAGAGLPTTQVAPDDLVEPVSGARNASPPATSEASDGRGWCGAPGSVDD